MIQQTSSSLVSYITVENIQRLSTQLILIYLVYFRVNDFNMHIGTHSKHIYLELPNILQTPLDSGDKGGRSEPVGIAIGRN